MSRCKSCNIQLTNFDDDFGYFGDSETLEINDNIHLSDT